MRGMHELPYWDSSSFLTFTLNDEHLPDGWSLDKSLHQKFMKRLRKKRGGKKLAYMHCGEYGKKWERPHYHSILYGEDFAGDARRHKKSESGEQLYQSDELDEIWGKGHCLIGQVTFQSIAYVARYLTKKQTGNRADQHYKLNRKTGEVYDSPRIPEYMTTSRRPAIGKKWIEEWGHVVYRDDMIVMNGKEMKPPRYYDNVRAKTHEKQMQDTKQERERVGKERDREKDRRLTWQQARAREENMQSKEAIYSRGL